SEELAMAWRPLAETWIEAFGPLRAMFESNFPVDKASVSYRTLWNTFKRLVSDYSEDEKRSLFAKTAINAYRLPETLGDG
ncbi:MAG: amidohydrolase family protein, partial [Rhodospirillales bacterium]